MISSLQTSAEREEFKRCFSQASKRANKMLNIKADQQTQDVKELYEKFPYPSAIVDDSLLVDLANVVGFLLPEDDLCGWKVLDAGCGTGQRLLGLAGNYPEAQFKGIDIAAASLEVATQLARKHGISNVTFGQENLLEVAMEECFDLIVSTGVLHHLTDPQAGLNNLCRLLRDDGLILLWLYHSFGEFERLLHRELVLTLLGEKKNDLQEGINILEELKLSLWMEKYGINIASSLKSETSHLATDVDAFLHPVVNTYRFSEALELFSQANVDWVAVNGINAPGKSQLIDLEQVSEDLYFCVKDEELFASAVLIEKYKRLGKTEKLKAIELILRPTGFTVLAGRGASFKKLGSRIEANKMSRPAF
jgi:2-polyprenyl-3-methyl-5-hydroxy-6-metoxy-1,4-benzoquinol methylase